MLLRERLRSTKGIAKFSRGVEKKGTVEVSKDVDMNRPEQPIIDQEHQRQY